MRLFWENKEIASRTGTQTSEARPGRPPDSRLIDSRRRRRQRGNAIVELTLLTPLLFGLVLGVGDFCRVFYASIAVSNAARAGAQFAISKNMYGEPDAIRIAARDDAGTSIPVDVDSSFYCQCPDGSSRTELCDPLPACKYQAWVSVTTSYTFNTMVNWPGVPNSTALSSTAQMRIR